MQARFYFYFFVMKTSISKIPKRKRKEKKALKRESVFTLSTVCLILMPRILLSSTKREIAISNI